MIDDARRPGPDDRTAKAGIRAATREDVPSLEVLRRQALEAGLTGTYDQSEIAPLVATPDDRLPDWVASAETVVLVAATDITPIGFGAYDPAPGRVLGLYTAPAYQGRGCASAILDRFEARARADGHRRLRVAAPLTAVSFFEARGFERRDRLERAGITRIDLEKPISR